MNSEQLVRAQEKTKELIEYNQQTVKLKTFIEMLEENEYIRVSTVNQRELWENKERGMYQLFGTELVEILKKKLWEREEYLEKLDADDLVVE